MQSVRSNVYYIRLPAKNEAAPLPRKIWITPGLSVIYDGSRQVPSSTLDKFSLCVPSMLAFRGLPPAIFPRLGSTTQLALGKNAKLDRYVAEQQVSGYMERGSVAQLLETFDAARWKSGGARNLTSLGLCQLSGNSRRCCSLDIFGSHFQTKAKEKDSVCARERERERERENGRRCWTLVLCSTLVR